jgi:hypothetical protein
VFFVKKKGRLHKETALQCSNKYCKRFYSVDKNPFNTSIVLVS